MSELTAFLGARGYHRVPLARSAVGHFHTTGTLNGRPVEILVDTGASCTVVSMAAVHEIGLEAERQEFDASGAGGDLEQFKVVGADLRLGPFTPQLNEMAGLDFERINAPLRAQGSAEVDLILGTDVFDAHAAVIDYQSLSLFLRVITAK